MPEQQKSPPPEHQEILPDDAKLVSEARISGFRFSLRTLLVSFTALAVSLGLAKGLDIDLLSLLIQFAWVAVTGCVITGLFFAQHDQRAFCIGAGLVLSSKWLGGSNRFWFVMSDTLSDTTDLIGIPRGPILEIIYLGFTALIAIANGLLCIQAMRYFDRTNPPQG